MLKKIIIITPHFPPSNLAAVHRSRLFAKYLPEFGWEPIILTVHEKFYEEKLDLNLEKLLPSNLRIEKVNAIKTTKPRIIGDIGIRGFFSLYKRAKQIIQKENIDFLYIPIPSFYAALLGRMLNKVTGIKYGIDYIDPWVHEFHGSDKVFSRAWLSTKIAGILEPIAIKKTSLITGVAEGYYKGVVERNPMLKHFSVFGAMPYGGDEDDHRRVKDLGLKPYLFEKKTGKIQLVYAGAMLPKAYAPLHEIFKEISLNRQLFENIEFHFIGTGKSPNDPQGFNIKPIAEQYGLWNQIIFEYPARIPYLDVLIHLEAVNGVFILGSTEPHYTPSKVYQGVLSSKPILAVLHQESTAAEVVIKSKSGVVLKFQGEDLTSIQQNWIKTFASYLKFIDDFDPASVDKVLFSKYSAKQVTRELAELLNKVTS